jgi:hypothetical protein
MRYTGFVLVNILASVSLLILAMLVYYTDISVDDTESLSYDTSAPLTSAARLHHVP